jgi:hypothetical protein
MKGSDMSDFEAKALDATDQVEAKDQNLSSVQGRSVFAIETVAIGVSVQTVFLTEDKKLMLAPAVFPDVVYAMNQIDELRNAVLQHFSQAAQVGAQVMAANAAMGSEQASAAAVSVDETV